MKPTISPVGDRAISIDFGQAIDPKINRQIRQVIEQIKLLQLDGIIELVPTYCALLVEYDAMLYSYSDICNIIEPTLEEGMTNTTNELVTVVEVPTVERGLEVLTFCSMAIAGAIPMILSTLGLSSRPKN